MIRIKLTDQVNKAFLSLSFASSSILMATLIKRYPDLIQRKGTRFKAMAALGLVCFFWGTTWLASRQGVMHMPALQLAGIRQFLGGLVYVVYFIGRGRVLPRGKEWWPILVLSFLNFMMSNGLATWGVKYISGGLGSIIGAIFPLWLVIIGFFRQQPMPAKAIAGIVLGFGGICVVFYEHLDDFLNPQFTLGIILSLLATWAWAFGTLYTKEQAKEFNPYFSIGLQMMISGLVTYSVAHTTGLVIPIADIPWQSWAAIGYLVVFGSVISFIAYLYALQHLPAQHTSLYAYINPIVAVLLGALLFGEKLSIYIALGGLITLAGVYLVNQAFRKETMKEKVALEPHASS